MGSPLGPEPALIDVLKASTRFLEDRGLPTPRLDAEVLLAHGLRLRRIDLYLQHDRRLSGDEVARLRALVVERGKGAPVAYLTGEKEFFALAFRVTRDVLVPRPETERLVEAALLAIGATPAPRVCDVGTGSGAVAVAILARAVDATAVATDVSAAALAVAAENARRHGVEDRLTLREGAWLEPLRGTPDWGALDAVASNPPYVVRGDPALDPHVAAHEPALALYVPGGDPLEPARAIAAAAREALKPGGWLGIEIGAGSHEAAREMLGALGFQDVSVDPDAAGIPRVAHGRAP